MDEWLSFLARGGPFVLVPAALAAGFWLFEWTKIYRPSRLLDTSPAAVQLDYEDVDFVAEDGRPLAGWWIPHPRARGTMLHCPGQSGNMGDRLHLAVDYHQLGMNVFLFDYRGYGRSRGIPTEKGTYRDARAAFEVIRARYGDAEAPPVVVHGVSLGGAVAVQLALDKPVRGLILEGAFTSIRDMGARLYPWLPMRWLSRFRYDSLAKMPRLKTPLLLAHSREDERTPFEFGRRLYEAAAEPKRMVELTGRHRDAGWNRTPEYGRALQDFLDRVLGPLPRDNN
ncbi:MAG TPA: alpha/beta hydrolase [Kiritimatiellia bacterium]|nr:alpha/beta hydrolase [Kiritimatiellia bacterium]HRZ12811.1 alpha/beta hydrolase [Kiritimatiellia bacterium]HSA18237.1 alpha/beta hydrolase [Kiritimatiellia bacterium]